ncbi:Pentatricopeptide repeat-containing protein [Forsythia ovata]|uniref:Pentatricopeptide repeat-containing protein n=1 Tax=Forsythia ovata TaxID=205694 RepID=A0ABD1P6U3_9LAMI
MGLYDDIFVSCTLIDMYSTCGSVEDARFVFDEMPEKNHGRVEDARHVFEKMPKKNVVSWNALISGYGNHGRGIKAVELFERMISEGMVPNHVTFLSVLSSCNYSGLFDRGWEIFESMSKDCKVKPRAMHYACLIELLGREGLLDEAFSLIRDAPFRPTINMWAALLTACRIHKNFMFGKFAAEKL